VDVVGFLNSYFVYTLIVTLITIGLFFCRPLGKLVF